ncbi:hypothetical protein D029_0046, partial [Vibrio parahaemolyticus 970107]
MTLLSPSKSVAMIEKFSVSSSLLLAWSIGPSSV